MSSVLLSHHIYPSEFVCDLVMATTMENCVWNISHRLLSFNPHSDSELALLHCTNDEVEAVKHLMMYPQPQR